MAALSEAMRAVRVTGALFFNGEFSAPRRFATPAQDQIRARISPDSERMVLFHLVTEGRATACTAGHDEVTLAAGDIVVRHRPMSRLTGSLRLYMAGGTRHEKHHAFDAAGVGIACPACPVRNADGALGATPAIRPRFFRIRHRLEHLRLRSRK
jgi:hypothetical protein